MILNIALLALFTKTNVKISISNARRYALDGSDPVPFSVDAATGEISVASAAQLDRERRDSYELHIVATDSSPFAPLSATCNVTVSISDANDNSPNIDNDVTDFFIAPTTVAGGFVLGVTASDADLG